MARPKISIVIPVYIIDSEVLNYAEECLKSVRNNTEDFELIIIDNGGGHVLANYADIYVKNQTNVGYGPAINQGFKLASGDILCAMNDDVRVPKGWTSIFNILTSPRVGVVRPGEERESGNSLVEDYTWYHGFLWGVSRGTYNTLKNKYGELLDEQFILGNFEDLDLWKRMLDRGYQIFKDHRVKVWHYGGLTIHKIDHSKTNAENEKKFIEKYNLPEWRQVFYP